MQFRVSLFINNQKIPSSICSYILVDESILSLTKNDPDVTLLCFLCKGTRLSTYIQKQIGLH